MTENPTTTSSSLADFDCMQGPLDGTWLIEASAGTGKTYSLVHIVARLVVEKAIPIDKILLVTFTKPATAELAERVRAVFAQFVMDDAKLDENEEKLKARWASNPAFVDYKNTLRRAIAEFDDACVCTIHSFCEMMLSECTFSRCGNYDTAIEDDETVVHQAVDEILRVKLKDPTTPDILKDEILQANGWEEIVHKLLPESIQTIEGITLLPPAGKNELPPSDAL